MIFWLFVFLVIIVISAYFAYLSMKNFPRIPSSKEKYAVFLVRSLKALNDTLLQEVKGKLGDQIISLERLFKGDKAALVIFGPKSLLLKFSELNLLELEDFALIDSRATLVFEVGIQDTEATFSLVAPKLTQDEQVWYQIVLTGEKGDTFQAQTRVVVVSENKNRQQLLAERFIRLNKGIYKLSLPQTSNEIFEGFKKRLISPMRKNKFNLSPEGVLRLLPVS